MPKKGIGIQNQALIACTLQRSHLAGLSPGSGPTLSPDRLHAKFRLALYVYAVAGNVSNRVPENWVGPHLLDRMRIEMLRGEDLRNEDRGNHSADNSSFSYLIHDEIRRGIYPLRCLKLQVL